MYSKEKNLETILAIVLGLLVIHLISGLKILLTISVILLIIPIVSQTVSGWITFGWMKLSQAMGYVMSKVILSVIFFLILYPIAVLYRLTGKSGLKLKKTTNASYYVERNHKYVPKDLEDPW